MMRLIRPVVLLVLLGAGACSEPPKLGVMTALVSDLSNMRTWDPVLHGKGFDAYDQVMGFGPEIFPVMVSNLVNESPTAIYDEMSQRNPCIADVLFFMLLDLTNHKWQDFASEGVFVSTALPNPIFCLKWDRVAKFKVKVKFHELLDIDDKKP